MEKLNELNGLTRDVSLNSSKSTGSEPSSSPVSTYLDKIYGSLTTSSKFDFLKDVQHEFPETKIADPLASLTAFRAYIASPASNALRPAKAQDLSAPITDYFISSSHNTYLTGNQLSSDSAASCYTNVLLSGCRCVEIDVWDGQTETKSISYNGTKNASNDSSESSLHKVKDIIQEGLKRERSIRSSRQKAVSSKIGTLLGHKLPPKDEVPAASTCPATQIPARPEPRVLHGHTLTKGTTFREVCNAIRDSAFVTSDLPVIVSLEVHACIEQQESMLEIMEETWKGMLIEVTPEMVATQRPPPLETLKRKILIKVKWVPEGSDGQEEEQKQKEVDADPLNALAQHETQGISNSSETKQPVPPPEKPSKFLRALSRLAVFTKGFHFSHITQPEARVPGHVFSLSENAAREVHAKEQEAFFEHNRRFFMRIYPKSLRVNSSNLDPSFFWRSGAQIVALNWQNVDKGMMLNRGMFAGEKGWVLKPQGYRSSDPEASTVTRRHLHLSIEILAGQDLPLPPGDTNEKGFHPYVSCSLHIEQPDEGLGSVPDDNSTDSGSEKSSYKRSIKSAKGKNPDFGAQKIQFPTIHNIVEELTFVRFKIKDDELGRDSTAAWACIKLDRLQQGYRLIHLYDCSGAESNGFLLVRIVKDLS